jgi:uncharacterized membrane protein YphA (DoxX/SURF4 family)
MMAVAVVVAILSLPLAVLTAFGSHARGASVAAVLVSAVFFPVAWTVWYLKDEHPYRSGQDA